MLRSKVRYTNACLVSRGIKPRKKITIDTLVHSYTKYLEMKGDEYNEALLAEHDSNFGKVRSCMRFDLLKRNVAVQFCLNLRYRVMCIIYRSFLEFNIITALTVIVLHHHNRVTVCILTSLHMVATSHRTAMTTTKYIVRVWVSNQCR